MSKAKCETILTKLWYDCFYDLDRTYNYLINNDIKLFIGDEIRFHDKISSFIDAGILLYEHMNI